MARKASYEQLAADAAERVQRAHQSGEQLTFLADEAPATRRDPDAPKRGKGKALSQMREWLAGKGYQLPEDVLAQLAGLNTGETVLQSAMRETEEILLWAQDGAALEGKEGNKQAPEPTMAQRLATLQQILAVRLRAADALMPYGTAKASPDVQVQQAVTINMPGGDRAAQARDITPKSSRSMAPPPMPEEIEQKQSLSNSQSGVSDGENRTDEVKR